MAPTNPMPRKGEGEPKRPRRTRKPKPTGASIGGAPSKQGVGGIHFNSVGEVVITDVAMRQQIYAVLKQDKSLYIRASNPDRPASKGPVPRDGAQLDAMCPCQTNCPH
jgi:hypothetical protein